MRPIGDWIIRTVDRILTGCMVIIAAVILAIYLAIAVLFAVGVGWAVMDRIQ